MTEPFSDEQRQQLLDKLLKAGLNDDKRVRTLALVVEREIALRWLYTFLRNAGLLAAAGTAAVVFYKMWHGGSP